MGFDISFQPAKTKEKPGKSNHKILCFIHDFLLNQNYLWLLEFPVIFDFFKIVILHVKHIVVNMYM